VGCWRGEGAKNGGELLRGTGRMECGKVDEVGVGGRIINRRGKEE